jgi:hypothetical protein
MAFRPAHRLFASAVSDKITAEENPDLNDIARAGAPE